MSSLDIASTGAIAQSRAIDNIANNIANVNTISFKKGYFATTDLPYTNEKRAGGAVNVNSNVVVPTSIQCGAGTAVSAIIKDQKQGDAINTGNSLDVRIDGLGFFVLNKPDGTQAYTRDGRFQIDPNTNQIVTNDGYVVSPGVNIPPENKSISIRDDGVVMVTLPNNDTPQEQGQLEIATFVNPAGLNSIGDNLYLQTDASGNAQLGVANQDIYGRLFSGWLEGSNVDPISEMTNLVKGQRAYEMNIKVISTSDQMMQKLANG
jgi:flagellar basal-body rod protein FlgG